MVFVEGGWEGSRGAGEEASGHVHNAGLVQRRAPAAQHSGSRAPSLRPISRSASSTEGGLRGDMERQAGLLARLQAGRPGQAGSAI